MGRGIAACLAEAGYDIAFSYYPGMHDPLKAVETSEAILREKGAEVWCYPADLSKREAPKWLFDNAIADLKGLDLLVNNAGVNIPRPTTGQRQRTQKALCRKSDHD